MSAENYPSSTSQPFGSGYLIQLITGPDVTMNGTNANVPILLDDAGDQAFLELPAGVWAITTYIAVLPDAADYAIGSVQLNLNTYDDAGVIDYAGVTQQTPFLQFVNVAAQNYPFAADYTTVVSLNRLTRFSLSVNYAGVAEDTVISNVALYATFLAPSVRYNLA